MGVCIRINEVKINFSGCRERKVYATTVYIIKYGCSCSSGPFPASVLKFFCMEHGNGPRDKVAYYGITVIKTWINNEMGTLQLILIGISSEVPLRDMSSIQELISLWHNYDIIKSITTESFHTIIQHVGREGGLSQWKRQVHKFSHESRNYRPTHRPIDVPVAIYRHQTSKSRHTCIDDNRAHGRVWKHQKSL